MAENVADAADKATQAAADGAIKIAEHNEKGISALDGLKASLGDLGTKFSALMSPPAGLIIVGVAAAAAALYGLYKWWNKDAEAAERAAKTAEKAK